MISFYSRWLSLYKILLAKSAALLLNFSFIENLFFSNLLLINDSVIITDISLRSAQTQWSQLRDWNLIEFEKMYTYWWSTHSLTLSHHLKMVIRKNNIWYDAVTKISCQWKTEFFSLWKIAKTSYSCCYHSSISLVCSSSSLYSFTHLLCSHQLSKQTQYLCRLHCLTCTSLHCVWTKEECCREKKKDLRWNCLFSCEE